MNIQFFSEIARKYKSRNRSSYTAKRKSDIMIMQRIHNIVENKKKRNPEMTVTISEKAMEAARFKVGDRVEIAYIPKNDSWQIIQVSQDDNKRGYNISAGSKNNGIGKIRFTLYPTMERITMVDRANISRISNDENSLETKLGCILFSLKKDTLSIKYDEEKL